ncbi:MAG: alkaline phosphatase D family protein [Bdellovibrionales bacterium]|nr:alkaline phosphatase D family protein [Bdellovibrionales bacterium]
MIKFVSAIVVFMSLVHCSTKPAEFDKTPTGASPQEFRSGYLPIVQGPTSDKETLINILVPHLKKYTYEFSVNDQVTKITPYATVTEPSSYYKIEKFHLKNLSPKTKYTLTIHDTYKDKPYIVDQRNFKTLDLTEPTPKFAVTSCMSDEWKFQPDIDAMWSKFEKQNVDFVIFSGDTVYVDSFGFVDRQKATAKDLWYRYSQTLTRLPFYHQKQLVPVFATWDDHDFGTNDGNRDTKSKAAALKLFSAVFQGEKLDDGTWQPAGLGVASVFKGYNQQFIFMDDRYFRQPNKDQKTKEAYGHWGKAQHDWLLKQLRENKFSWIVNGNQVNSGKALGFKESLQENHPLHFDQLKKDLSAIKTPFVFLTGDVHFSEIMKTPLESFGFQTYEITSSAMHSYNGRGWDNPLRIPGKMALDYNFMVISATAKANSTQLQIDTLGLAPMAYFSETLEVKR